MANITGGPYYRVGEKKGVFSANSEGHVKGIRASDWPNASGQSSTNPAHDNPPQGINLFTPRTLRKFWKRFTKSCKEGTTYKERAFWVFELETKPDTLQIVPQGFSGHHLLLPTERAFSPDVLL